MSPSSRSQRRQARLLEELPDERLDSEALVWMHSKRGRGIGVGVSGGMDSVTLLHRMSASAQKWGIRFVVLHFNHGLRGRDSDGDARFTRRLAVSLGCEFRHELWPAEERGPTEGEARSARFAFFQRACMQDRLEGVLLAHHADDSAETLVQRLMRGSGCEGLGGPRPVQVFRNGLVVARPFLSLGRSELEQVAGNCGLHWREDATNAEPWHERNRIRHQVFPVLRAATGRPVIEAFTRVRQRCAAESDALEWAVDRLEQEEAKALLSPTSLSRDLLCNLPDALALRLLARWLSRRKPETPPSLKVMEAIIEHLRGGRGRCSWGLAGGWQVTADSRGVGLLLPAGAEPWPGAWLEVGGKLEERHGGLLVCSRIRRPKSEAGTAADSIHLDREHIREPLWVRCLRPGDRLAGRQPAGSPTVAMLLAKRGVGFAERKRLPVVCDREAGVLWVPGLSPAPGVICTPQTTRALKLTYTAPTTP